MEGCRGTASSRKNFRVHFSHLHPWDRIVILEDGNQPHPWCPQCDMFVPQESLNQALSNSAIVPARDGEEAVEAGSQGDRGTDGEGLLGIWDTTYGGYFFQLLGANVVVLRQQLAGGITEPTEAAVKMGMTGKKFGKGGGG